MICSRELRSVHPELFHYTGRVGFEGIAKTNTLWATHFRSLNDDAEVSTLKPLLIDAVASVFDQQVKKRNRGIRNRYYHKGGSASQAKRFVDSLYRATFERENPSFAVDSYTVSFSTHAVDTSYERENGIESQWRCYAKDGYCLVFDTAALEDLLAAEFNRLDFTHLNLEDVRYITDEKIPLRNYFDFIEPAIRIAVDQCFDSDQRDMGVIEFLRCATLLKRRKYQKEREVRIVAIPGAEGYQEQGIREHPKRFIKKPIPTMSYAPKRHITLFDGINVKLPIKRVIVGPSDQQARNAIFASSITDCDVILSTPRS